MGFLFFWGGEYLVLGIKPRASCIQALVSALPMGHIPSPANGCFAYKFCCLLTYKKKRRNLCLP
jgi:hypothetical protein